MFADIRIVSKRKKKKDIESRINGVYHRLFTNDYIDKETSRIRLSRHCYQTNYTVGQSYIPHPCPNLSCIDKSSRRQ